MTSDQPPCASPLSWETLVTYWAGDLPPEEEETTELHLLGCASCTREAERVAAVTEAIRREPAAVTEPAPAPVLRLIPGEGRDQAEAPAPAPRPRRRWLLAVTGGATLAAAAALFLMIPWPRGVHPFHLPAPVRDAVLVELSPPAGAREIRLLPEIREGQTVNAARVRRLDGGGGWLAVRVEAGPPFAVVVARGELTPGRYDLELVHATPEGREEPRGVYRFHVK